ncbi:TonB-dependent receptor [Bowmanella sp. Y26]|uniref:TonB-dependent receptor n=1 Tax=Bowmanella yangjiangensis TaxID=2811230 RepID=UPI001BDBCF48|nr:TonB-dependent receptor [Bowmanella yangjiangensis]MBT1064614.1 TonB-dependent receptor [Bowmanella yangjiangensis]
MTHKFKLLASTMLASFYAGASLADEAPDGSSLIVIGERIEVIGRQNGVQQSSLAGSVDLINRDQLQNEHVNVTVDLLKKIPGIYFARFNQGIVSTDFAIRGFNGEGSMPHVKLLIDGVPSNLHLGLAEMDALFPMEVERMEVVKGNQDVRYGLHNLAGSVNMHSRRDEASEAEVLYGSFNTREAQFYHGHNGERLSQHYFVGHRQTDGYRDHAELEKQTFSGKWFYQLSPQTEFGLIARYFNYEAQAPGYLTEAQSRQDPSQSASYAQDDSGDKQTRHISLHWQHDTGAYWHFNGKLYWQQFDRHRYLQYTATSPQQERLEKDQQQGAILQLSRNLGDNWLFLAGLDYQAQDNQNSRHVTEKRVRQRTFRNWDFSYNNWGGYSQLQYREGPWTISGGVRVDRFSGELLNLLSQQTRHLNDNGTTVLPKFNLLYQVNDDLNLFANYGVSFQAPTGADAYVKAGTEHELSKNYGYESGVHWQPTAWLNSRLSWWQQDAKDELTPKTDGSGDFENLGETRRRGWDLALSADLNADWSGFASYTRQKATLTEPGPGKVDSKGNWLLGVPAYTATLGLIYSGLDKLNVALYGHWQGDYYVSNFVQAQRYGDYRLIDLAFNYDFGWGNAGLRINNLFDTYHEYVYLVGAETIHSPADGRGVNLSLSYHF